MNTPPDVERILGGLKDFQRATVEHVFARLYTDADAVDRFLVADEVGLGKTKIAQGVIAKAVDHLWDDVERIDVLYVCSNQSIARQNIRRLQLPDEPSTAPVLRRLTLLPRSPEALSEKVNLVPLTPGTSLDMKRGWATGIRDERVLLHQLLTQLWGPLGPHSTNVFRVTVRPKRFERALREAAEPHLVEGLLERFEAGAAPHRDELRALLDAFPPRRKPGPELAERRRRLIAGLRHALAHACVDALQPDIVVLDEFQRFPHLLDVDSEEAELAQTLFEYEDVRAGDRVRLLLLSATPYKPYTDRGDAEDDHHEDFLRTVRFLERDSERIAQLQRRLGDVRSALLDPAHQQLAAAVHDVETSLQRVMCRTERLAVDPSRSGMLEEHRVRLAPSPADFDAFADLARIASDVGASQNVVEYWKSASHPLELMEQYELKSALMRRLADGGVDAPSSDATLIDWSAIDRYEPLEPANGRMRWLLDEVHGAGAWRLLWLAPSLPYYSLGAPWFETTFETKRLIFSSWQVVPRSIASVLTYETERLAHRSAFEAPENTSEWRRNRGRQLVMTRSEGRLTGMPVIALIGPWERLAEIGDPIALLDGREPASAEDALHAAEARLRPLLEQLPPGSDSGPDDERWYWAAPLLLDLLDEPSDTLDWWRDDPKWFEDGEPETAAVAHVSQLVEMGEGGGADLGRRPDDLLTVLAQLSVGAPGLVFLRSITRDAGTAAGGWASREVACRAARAFVDYANGPEPTSVIRGQVSVDLPMWRQTLIYAVSGCLQAVIDEWIHLVRDAESLVGGEDETLGSLAEAVEGALGLRTSTVLASELRVEGGQVRHVDDRRLRTSFAQRFGDARSEDGAQAIRPDQVRGAFNSPFWPFVLASTSVGQEGLDFHLYSHAVVHWNLPSNPVDLEQREGRVHRWKCHAVRRSLGARYRTEVLDADDVWAQLFSKADEARAPGELELVPYWMVHDPAVTIDRYVPMLQTSKEITELPQLLSRLARYRLVFGQPRQDDLLELLDRSAPLEDGQALIDLRPPARHWTSARHLPDPGPTDDRPGVSSVAIADPVTSGSSAVERHLERSALSRSGRRIADVLLDLVMRAVPEAGPPEAVKFSLVWKRDDRVWVRLWTDMANQASFHLSDLLLEPDQLQTTLGWTGSPSRGHERKGYAARTPNGTYAICVKTEEEAVNAAPILERLLRGSWMSE